MKRTTMKTDVRKAAMTTYEQIKQEGKVEGKTEAGAAPLARLLARRFRKILPVNNYISPRFNR